MSPGLAQQSLPGDIFRRALFYCLSGPPCRGPVLCDKSIESERLKIDEDSCVSPRKTRLPTCPSGDLLNTRWRIAGGGGKVDCAFGAVSLWPAACDVWSLVVSVFLRGHTHLFLRGETHLCTCAWMCSPRLVHAHLSRTGYHNLRRRGIPPCVFVCGHGVQGVAAVLF